MFINYLVYRLWNKHRIIPEGVPELRHKKRFRKRTALPPGKHILIITMIIFVVCVFLSMQLIDKRIEPVLMHIAERRVDEFATRAINSAVRYVEDYSFDDMVNITYDNEGNFSTYNWNNSIISEINRVATDRVEEFFINVNRGDPLEFEDPLTEPYEYSDGAEDMAKQDPTLVEIPLGQVTGNTVLANLGPKIPINFEVVGNVRTNVVREVEEFGINGAWVSLYIDVEADVQIVVPFTSDVTTVNTEIYLDGSAIMGKVPDFYGGGSNGPSIAIPKDDLQNN